MTANQPPQIAHRRMGVAETSYSMRQAKGAGSAAHPGFHDGLDLIKHVAELGGGGGQVRVAGWDTAMAERVRAFCEKAGLFVEGQIGLPKDADDAARFERELATLKLAGGRIARTILHGGRRYEVFDSLPAYEAWRKRAWESLRLAEPIVRKLGMKLAIENHKEVRIDELLDLVKRTGSEAIGICVDTGNSIALLEDPYEVVEAYAPFAMSVHVKDMGVKATPEGFLLSEVPLGDGFLDLPRIVKRLRAANPTIAFNLEMITRDPLSIPCLTDKYWITMPAVPARDLARTLALVRAKENPAKPLPAITGLDPAARLAFEEDNIRKSYAYARAKLDL